MLHFESDGFGSKFVIRLPVRPTLGKVIPANNGYANLGGLDVHPEVRQLVCNWRTSGRITTVWESSECGDFAMLNSGITVYTLARMDTEWCTLQSQLAEALEHG